MEHGVHTLLLAKRSYRIADAPECQNAAHPPQQVGAVGQIPVSATGTGTSEVALSNYRNSG